MFLLGESLIYSATDLAGAAECEFGLLRNLDYVLGRAPRGDALPDPMLVRTSALGADHERRELDKFVARFGSGVVTMARPEHGIAGYSDAHLATLAALRNGADMIYQATVFDGRFLGYCDFLVKESGGYAVYDTKLSRHAKVSALIQLSAYADILSASGIAMSPDAHLILGSNALTTHRLREITEVYRQSREELQNILDAHAAESLPASWADPRYTACGRCEHCAPEIAEHRDLLLVAGMRGSQRSRLIDAGITTIDELATESGAVENVPLRILDSLRAQASIQIREEISATPQFEVFDNQALSLIPAPDQGDVFFDFEGDPLWSDSGSPDWGLEYLFGVVLAGPVDKKGPAKAASQFRPFWAHDREQEREALVSFLDFVTHRLAENPGMHIYHYAPYEKTALLRLAGRYGVGEETVDDLLRRGTLVDLYPIVRASIRIGAQSYGLKKLEPLYLSSTRDGDVTNAVASITEYAAWCDLRDAGKVDEAAEVLDQIAQYNRIDCESTLELRDWLLTLRTVDSVATATATATTTATAPATEPNAVESALRDWLGARLPQDRSPLQNAVALYAGSIEYHRRERKPFWWQHFDRLNSPVDEWPESGDVMIVDSAVVTQNWRKTAPRQQKLRRFVRLDGTFGSGTGPGVRADVRLVYDSPVPDGFPLSEAGQRGLSNAKIVESALDYVVVEELLPKATPEYSQIPLAVVPGAPIPTNGQEDAIESAGAAVLAALPELPRTAFADLAMLSPPRTTTQLFLPIVRDGHYADAITSALLDLDNSYLAVRGPPGTGKTFTAAQVITTLVREHRWKIGVVAQSHAVVENLLAGVIRAGTEASRVGKKTSGAVSQGWTELASNDYVAFVEDAAGGCVIGGTAWDFAAATRVGPGSLDLLVIDEAGQFSLANTLAVSVSARNLLLLGDPQQLPQVSQGTHAEPVNMSALEWLAGGHGALPAERGYFLERTWRMHPALCEPVSELSYEGKLLSESAVTATRNVDGLEPGLHVVSLDHAGNEQDSPEEASYIGERIHALLGLPWTDPHTFDGTRPLTAQDFLVVAPYNAQVAVIRHTLDAAGLGAVSVGTVDKFQGRQAPVVFISMTASDLSEVPRGMEFLLSRNRLNVAVSRGQWATVLVRSACLTHFLPHTPDGLVTLGTFMALCAGAMRTGSQPNALPSPR